jgi:hypothetical protein
MPQVFKVGPYLVYFWINWLGFVLLLNSKRDEKTGSKHIANALAKELKDFSTVAKFETVQKEETG